MKRGAKASGRCEPAVTICAVLALIAAGAAASEEAVSAARVHQLIRQMDDDDPTQRDRAEDALAALGPAALPHIPPLDKIATAEQRLRLRRVLPKLWQAKVQDQAKGSLVTTEPEPASLKEIMRQIERQSGNRVALRAGDEWSGADRPLDLTLRRAPFWEALDRLTQQAGLSLYLDTTDRSVEIVGQPGPVHPVAHAGAFRIVATQITARRPLTEPPTPAECIVQLDLAIEPRFDPLLFELDTADFSIVDDRGQRLEFVEPRLYSFPPERHSYHVPLGLRIVAPDRAAKSIARLGGRVMVTLPAHVEEVAFGPLEPNRPMERETASLRVRLSGVRDDDGIWTFPVHLEPLVKTGPVESHLVPAMNARVYLRRPDGSRFDQNGGLSTLDDGIEFLFVDAPGKLGDHELVVEVPTGATRLPVDFEFRNLPLP